MLEDYLTQAHRLGATEVFVRPRQAPHVRTHAALSELPDASAPSAEEIESALRQWLTDGEWQTLQSEKMLSCTVVAPHVGRVRVRAAHVGDGITLCLHMTPQLPQAPAQLGLPAAVLTLAEKPCGLVIITGPQHSGRSTTMVALVDSINRQPSRHVVSAGDPIESLHESQSSLMSHRELGVHTHSWSAVVAQAQLQDADVLVLEEGGIEASFEAVLARCHGGALVITTLRASSATRALEQLLDAVPESRRANVRLQLAEALRGVVCQELVRNTAGGLSVLCEVLLQSAALQTAVRENKLSSIASIIEQSGKLGMQNKEAARIPLIQSGLLSNTR